MERGETVERAKEPIQQQGEGSRDMHARHPPGLFCHSCPLQFLEVVFTPKHRCMEGHGESAHVRGPFGGSRYARHVFMRTSILPHHAEDQADPVFV